MSNLYTVNSCKFDGTIQKTWVCQFVEETSEYLLLLGKFSQEINHKKLGLIKLNTICYEYFYKETWFNIFSFYEPTGKFKFYYCNINMPPMIKNNVINYIDLDIDILVYNDLSFEILDEDEFETNSIFFGYTEYLKSKTKESVENLIKMIEQKQFPFSNTQSVSI